MATTHDTSIAVVRIGDLAGRFILRGAFYLQQINARPGTGSRSIRGR